MPGLDRVAGCPAGGIPVLDRVAGFTGGIPGFDRSAGFAGDMRGFER